MKTEIFSASRSRKGSRALPTDTMRPSAGDTTASGSSGISRAGSRKNCRMKAAAAQKGMDHHLKSTETRIETTTAIPRNGQPSLATIGCG